jgi:hypothetical protein
MGIQEDLKEIKEKLNKEEAEKELKKKKKPRFKLPFSARVKAREAKQNYVTVMKINENGFVDFQKEKIVAQTTIIDGIPRLATPEYVLHWKKNPIIIQPHWSVTPFNPSAEAKKSLNDGSNTNGYKILLARMKSDFLGSKKPISSTFKWVGGIILAVVLGYALLTGGG